MTARLDSLRALQGAVKEGKPAGEFCGIKIVSNSAIPPGYAAMVGKTDAVVLCPNGKVLGLSEILAALISQAEGEG